MLLQLPSWQQISGVDCWWKNGRVAARLRREHRTRCMTICHSLPAGFCLRRAVRALAASDRQTSLVRASRERPADGRKPLTARGFVTLGSDSDAIFALFSREKQGRDGWAAPLFAARVGVISRGRRRRLACASNAGKAMTPPHAKGDGDHTARSEEATPAASPSGFGGTAAGCWRFPAGGVAGNEVTLPGGPGGPARIRLTD
jgi:hypothetical protein